jgi:hypothetical protein
MEKKYAYALIKIPLEISDTNEFLPLKDHIHVEFTECSELPPKSCIDHTNIMESFLSFLQPIQEIRPMTISKDEFKEQTARKTNTSFRAHRKYKNRHTAKSYLPPGK